jgi:hypothetical protein
MGHARKERVVLFGTDQRITSGPAAKRPHSKAEYMTAPERFAEPSGRKGARFRSAAGYLPPRRGAMVSVEQEGKTMLGIRAVTNPDYSYDPMVDRDRKINMRT